MTKMLTALCLAASTATAAAQEAKVTPLVTKELAGRDGKEGTMIMVEYAPGGSDPAHRHNASVFGLCAGRGSGDAGEGWEGSDTGAGPDIL